MATFDIPASSHSSNRVPCHNPSMSDADGVPAASPPSLITTMLDVVEAAFHSSPSEWLFFRELRVGTGTRNDSLQRLDAFALNSLPHTAMKRVCYEIKTSRADFLCELRNPLKRRIGLRYSNEFYFVTPARLACRGPGRMRAHRGRPGHAVTMA